MTRLFSTGEEGGAMEPFFAIMLISEEREYENKVCLLEVSEWLFLAAVCRGREGGRQSR